MLTLHEARAIAVALGAQAPTGEEVVALRDAAGRVLAGDVVAPLALPPFRSSAMDGFCVRAGDVAAPGVWLPWAGESRAGTPGAPLPAGHAAAISTGAQVPSGADTVVPVEEVTEEDRGIRIDGPLRPGRHVRGAGEDIARGQAVLERGARLHPGAMAVLAGLGVARVAVRRVPRVSVLTTGDEVVAAGAELGPGEVFDVNGVVIPALVAAAGGRVVEVAPVADDLDATTGALERAVGDLILTCGGVSVGRHDHVRRALEALGAREDGFRVRLQPGKPTWLGALPGSPPRPVLGLPGNPASALSTAALLAWPALAAMGGGGAPHGVRARLTMPVRRNPGRLRALRATVRVGMDGVLEADPLDGQESHRLASLVATEALALVDAGDGSLPAGSPVVLWPLPWTRLRLADGPAPPADGGGLRRAP